MRILTVLALTLSLSAFAGEYATKKISFSPSTYSGPGTQTYYSCWGLEGTVHSHLEALGATNIRVRCSGGLDNGGAFPVYLYGTFDAPVATTGGVTTPVELKGWDSCEFNSQFLDYVIPMFSGVKVVRRSASCMGGNMDRWSYLLDVTL